MLFYMQTWCYYYADNWRSCCFVLTVSMILFYAGVSTFFSTAKIGLSVTIGQALVSWCFWCKRFWGNSLLDKGQPTTCASLRSHTWLSPFNGVVALAVSILAFINLEVLIRFFLMARWHKKDVFWGEHTVLSASVGLGDALCLLPQFRSQLYPMLFLRSFGKHFGVLFCAVL